MSAPRTTGSHYSRMCPSGPLLVCSGGCRVHVTGGSKDQEAPWGTPLLTQMWTHRREEGPLWSPLDFSMDHQSPDDYLTVMLGNSMRTRPRGWLPSTLLPNFWKRRLQRTGQQTEPLGKAASGPSRASVNPGHSPRVT